MHQRPVGLIQKNQNYSMSNARIYAGIAIGVSSMTGGLCSCLGQSTNHLSEDAIPQAVAVAAAVAAVVAAAVVAAAVAAAVAVAVAVAVAATDEDVTIIIITNDFGFATVLNKEQDGIMTPLQSLLEKQRVEMNHDQIQV